MQDNLTEYAEQCRKFCTYRYMFFKRSSSYSLVKEAIETNFKEYGRQEPLTELAKSFIEIHRRSPGLAFNDDILKTARQISIEAFKAVELDIKYNTPWVGDGSWVLSQYTNNGEHIVKMGSGISVFDAEYLMEKKIAIPVSIKEILTLDRSMETIKDRIKKQFRDSFPIELGIPDKCRKSDGALAGGKFLPFDKWERCIHSYDEHTFNNKRTADIAKEIPERWAGYYKDRSNAHRKIAVEIKEAKRLIESAANGTFPD